MKKIFLKIVIGVVLACILFVCFLYTNNEIGVTSSKLEADIRSSQKIKDDWTVDGSVSSTMAAYISYPQDLSDHSFSVYVNRPGLSFGYFFRGGGTLSGIQRGIVEFTVEGYNERAFISMNQQQVQQLEIDDGNTIQVVDIDRNKPFAIVLPMEKPPTICAKQVCSSKKVTDHHAIVPTISAEKVDMASLPLGEREVLKLAAKGLLRAVDEPHRYAETVITADCAGQSFTAKGKTILTPGWKEIERRFKASFKTDADEDAPELARELPELTEGQTFDPVEASITEHFTTPPKPYTEDTLLSAMERAGAEDMPEDAERQGLGTPATRASILEKLVQMGFVERRGKQLLPTKDGHNLACVLPEALTSPQLTAQWETELTAIAKGQADPEGFMAGIAEMTRGLIANYSQISEDAQKLFQTERVVIGKCPRCGESVYEGKKNYYCGNRSCQFVMWKNDRFFEERGKAFTPKIAAALLKDGKAKVKGLRSMKTGKTYDGTVLLADTGGKYVNYRVEQRGKN